MRTLNIKTIFIFSILLGSCNEKKAVEKTSISRNIESLEANVDVNEVKSDFMKWWTYYSNHISLASNFRGLNEASDWIEKEVFLEKLITGDYIPLKMKTREGLETYKLFKLEASADQSIGETIRNESRTSLKYFKMEGQAMPEFHLTDLKGNTYTQENTRGKNMILKTWFINCKACVAEFPELNELVETYQERNDLIFLSLALNSKAELEHFLQKKDFEYQVAADQKNFIQNKLDLTTYPTHIIVDKRGTILKVVNKASEMISFFENNKEMD